MHEKIIRLGFRGYVMAGFPMTTSDEVSIDEQIEILETLALPPQYVLIMNVRRFFATCKKGIAF